MNRLSAPNQARIPIGAVVVNGQKLEVVINLEWARFFESLTVSTNSNTDAATNGKNGADGVAVMIAGDGTDSVEFIPGPPGPNGKNGEPGPAVGMLINEGGESPDLIPGPPGAGGRQGDAGLALFLLQDADPGVGETFLIAPQPTSESFIAPALTNGWVNFGLGFGDAGYYKDPAGVVHLRGLVSSGSGLPIFNLPVGYRPYAGCLFAVVANGAFGRVDVNSSGDVALVTGSNTYVSLEGITFRAV